MYEEGYEDYGRDEYEGDYEYTHGGEYEEGDTEYMSSHYDNAETDFGAKSGYQSRNSEFRGRGRGDSRGFISGRGARIGAFRGGPRPGPYTREISRDSAGRGSSMRGVASRGRPFMREAPPRGRPFMREGPSRGRPFIRGGAGSIRGGFPERFQEAGRNSHGSGDQRHFEQGGSFMGRAMDPELMTKSFFVQSKKFYVDVKENRRGLYVKISEVTADGQKMKILLDLSTVIEFHEKLVDICDAYNKLGTPKIQRGYENERTLQSETVFVQDKRYYMDLKENHRGRFLKISMAVGNERSQIVVPADGMAEIRDILTDVLNTFGREEQKRIADAKAADRDHVIEHEGKKFKFHIGNNARGTFLRITEEYGNFQTSVTVDEKSWKDFTTLVDEAMDHPERAGGSTTASAIPAVAGSASAAAEDLRK